MQDQPINCQHTDPTDCHVSTDEITVGELRLARRLEADNKDFDAYAKLVASRTCLSAERIDTLSMGQFLTIILRVINSIPLAASYNTLENLGKVFDQPLDPEAQSPQEPQD